MTHLRVLGRRDFRVVLAAGLVSLTGDWLLGVGMAYYVYRLTGSTMAAAGMLAASAVPAILVGPLAGVYVDRWDRRRTMIVANLLSLVGLLPLLAVDSPGRVWIAYLVVAFSTTVDQFFDPARAALLPLLVEPELRLSANALNGQTGDLARLVGAGLGGVAVGLGGLPVVVLADAASFLVSAVLLGTVRARPPAAVAAAPAHPVRRLVADGRSGLRFAVSTPVLRVLLAFEAVVGFGEGVFSTLLAPFTRHVLHGSGGAYGLVVAAQAVGGLAGGAVVAALAHWLPAHRTLGVATLALGAVDLAIAVYPVLLPALWPAVALMLLVGVPGAAAMAAYTTLLQHGVPDRLRGRVFTALSTAGAVTGLAGTLAAGALGDRVGIIPVFSLQGGCLLAAGVLAVAALYRRPALEPDGTGGREAVPLDA